MIIQSPARISCRVFASHLALPALILTVVLLAGAPARASLDVSKAFAMDAQTASSAVDDGAFGQAVAVGDFDNDGYDDIAIGTKGLDGFGDSGGCSSGSVGQRESESQVSISC